MKNLKKLERCQLKKVSGGDGDDPGHIEFPVFFCPTLGLVPEGTFCPEE
ncbi:bacteriocin-like protein [Chryseobacterium sp. PMSZPI]|nr:hypothetical protein [Chryseobacterium sp. PMSZPI]